MNRVVKQRRASRRAMQGLTLVELMVATVIGLLIVLAAVAAFTATRRSASTVDASSQLRDDARFASDIIQRLAVQTGFEDLGYVSRPYLGSVSLYKGVNGVDPSTLKPAVFGYDNAIPSTSDPLNNATARSAGSAGYGNDALILQYDSVRVTDTTTDGSMISCDGFAPGTPTVNRGDREVSILYVNTSSGGEPALMCMRRNDSTGTFSTPAPLLKGVESFQVLYGVDKVVAATAPTGSVDSVPDSFLRADQMAVAGDDAATLTNWRRVRSLRIGMVLRGPQGSAQSSETQTLYPLGSNYESTNDPGSKFTATDGRLRQVITFTVQLRNCQNQGYQPSTSTTPCDVVKPS
mgnify:CR=1 FL=1